MIWYDRFKTSRLFKNVPYFVWIYESNILIIIYNIIHNIWKIKFMFINFSYKLNLMLSKYKNILIKKESDILVVILE